MSQIAKGWNGVWSTIEKVEWKSIQDPCPLCKKEIQRKFIDRNVLDTVLLSLRAGPFNGLPFLGGGESLHGRVDISRKREERRKEEVDTARLWSDATGTLEGWDSLHKILIQFSKKYFCHCFYMGKYFWRRILLKICVIFLLWALPRTCWTASSSSSPWLDNRSPPTKKRERKEVAGYSPPSFSLFLPRVKSGFNNYFIHSAVKLQWLWEEKRQLLGLSLSPSWVMFFGREKKIGFFAPRLFFRGVILGLPVRWFTDQVWETKGFVYTFFSAQMKWEELKVGAKKKS